jgi:N-acetylmuramoyl-L-alanine amidase
MDIQYLVIHCSATKPSMDTDAATIKEWHLDRGFSDIGYHYIIKRNGEVETGRSEDTQGAHALGYNDRSLGICLIGGVTEDDHTVGENNFTDDQWNSFAHLIEQLEDKYLGVKIIGHNEISKKFCPSFNVQQWNNDRAN